MKKRDKSKRYVMNRPLEIMPKRKQKFLYSITEKELDKAIRDVFKTDLNHNSVRPLTPSESSEMKIMDFSDKGKGFITAELPSGVIVQVQYDPLFDEIGQYDISLLKKQEVIKGIKKKLKI